MVLVAPILLALMVPAPSLGALAVKNKRTDHAPALAEAPADGEIRLFEIAYAAQSDRFAADSGIEAGMPVDFLGFVSQDKLPGGRIELSRFYVGCCAADARAYSVELTPPAGTPPLALDTWVRVQGKLTGRPGSTLGVAATSISEVDQPANPYN